MAPESRWSFYSPVLMLRRLGRMLKILRVVVVSSFLPSPADDDRDGQLQKIVSAGDALVEARLAPAAGDDAGTGVLRIPSPMRFHPNSAPSPLLVEGVAVVVGGASGCLHVVTRMMQGGDVGGATRVIGFDAALLQTRARADIDIEVRPAAPGRCPSGGMRVSLLVGVYSSGARLVPLLLGYPPVPRSVCHGTFLRLLVGTSMWSLGAEARYSCSRGRTGYRALGPGRVVVLLDFVRLAEA
ncbi:hypothetical protein C8R44DRAFT_869084 [Mycena epipterygia]|nr:hypothetical protein C8R44DRAFT_869084 [Mycena epipterygia]